MKFESFFVQACKQEEPVFPLHRENTSDETEDDDDNDNDNDDDDDDDDDDDEASSTNKQQSVRQY
eukprot:ANDGO_03019.mRNA.1 hypothetical protein